MVQLTVHQNGAPRRPSSPQRAPRTHPTNNDWLIDSWKSFLMILIASIILSLPILSKASPIDTNTLASRASVPSCAVKCLTDLTKSQNGCNIDDTKCICDVSFGTNSLVQSGAAKCLLDNCAFEERESFFNYLYTTCYGMDMGYGVGKVTGTPVIDTPFTVTLTGSGQVVTNVPEGVEAVYVLSTDGHKVTLPTPATPNPSAPTDPATLLPSGWRNPSTDTTSDSPATKPPLRTSIQEDGLSLGGKIAIGVLVPLASIGFIWGLLKYLRARKRDLFKFKAPPMTENDMEAKPGLHARNGSKAELPGDGEVSYVGAATPYDKPELDGHLAPVAKLAQSSNTLAVSEDERNKPLVPPRYGASEVYGSVAHPRGSHVKVYGSGAHPPGSYVELPVQSPHDNNVPELSPTTSSPAATRSAVSTVSPSSPQHNISRALGGTSPREESMQRALSSDNEAGLRPPLAGPVPSATELYPSTEDSDRVEMEEQERRLALKKEKVAEMRRLAEEEALLEKEEETLRRKKAAQQGR